MRERWVSVEGYEGLYEVSNLGNVRSVDRETFRVVDGMKTIQPVKGRLLNPSRNSLYPMVSLSKLGKVRKTYVHELVAKAFLGPRPHKEQICHRDGNHYNCRSDNLRYGTPRSNARDRVEHGTHAIGEKNPGAKLSNQHIREIRELIAVHESDVNIAQMFGVSRQTINSIRHNRGWRDVE